MDFGNVLGALLPGGSPLSLAGPAPNSKQLIAQALMGPLAGMTNTMGPGSQSPSAMSGAMPLNFLMNGVQGNNQIKFPG